MKLPKNFWLALASPLLILISTVAFFQRNDKERIQAVPAFMVGVGLIFSDLLVRKHGRKKVLFEIRKSNES